MERPWKPKEVEKESFKDVQPGRSIKETELIEWGYQNMLIFGASPHRKKIAGLISRNE